MQKAKIIVAVRKRPLFEKQKAKGYTDIIGIHNGNQVVVSEMKQKVDLTKYIEESVFNFDYAFGEEDNNEYIYNHIMSPLIDSAFQGAKVSCFAYGQTGSGKTYTMNGVMSKNIPGLYTLGAYDIFQRLSQPQNSHLTAYLSFYEIYCTKLFDLLNKRNQLILRQDAKSNINVVGLSQIPISSVQQFQNYLKVGSSQRVTSENSANSQSSRSHAILQISLKNGKKGFGKIYFIDLAGNQRGADHMNMKKQTQIDGQQINKSLLQLKECIRGLDQGKNHVPFRGSKLTMCLKDSFIGFCRTVMIGNISPSSGSSQNTLNTLRYADRVKQLKNSDQISKQDMKNREMMLPRGNKNAIKIAISNSDDEDDIAEKKRKALQDYGIKPEQKRDDKRNASLKEDLNSERRLSMGTSMKNASGAKGSSLAKNGLNANVNTNVSNRQIPPTKVVQQKKPGTTIMGRKQSMTPREQTGNQFQSQRFRNEPMQIQRPHGNSVDMRKNLSGIVNYEKQQFNNNFMGSNNNGSNIYTANQHNNMGYSNNMSDYNNNVRQQQQQQQPVYGNQYGGYNNQQPTNNIQNPVYKANNFFSNNRPQVEQPGNMIRQQPSTNLVNNSNYPASINNAQNMQNPYIQQQQIFRPQQNIEPPQQMNFQSWNQMVDCMSTSRDPRFKDELRQRLNAHLFSEQNQLINLHSNTLQNEIQKIKSEMQVIKLIEQDRGQLSSKQYAQMMLQSIDDKIGQLQMLRQKVTTFSYKLDDMQAIQEEFYSSRRENNHNGQDEQLLDDFE